MATQAQLKQLRAADGKAFDQLFTLPDDHASPGAITMSTDLKGRGNNIRMEEMADDRGGPADQRDRGCANCCDGAPHASS
ncbi:hypothetical protein GCM10023238_31690 [Streptomyces heliomycini]